MTGDCVSVDVGEVLAKGASLSIEVEEGVPVVLSLTRATAGSTRDTTFGGGR
ncbi:hypothetical protein Tco_0981950, partial [Tanacetum coccineum]